MHKFKFKPFRKLNNLFSELTNPERDKPKYLSSCSIFNILNNVGENWLGDYGVIFFCHWASFYSNHLIEEYLLV